MPVQRTLRCVYENRQLRHCTYNTRESITLIFISFSGERERKRKTKERKSLFSSASRNALPSYLPRVASVAATDDSSVLLPASIFQRHSRGAGLRFSRGVIWCVVCRPLNNPVAVVSHAFLAKNFAKRVRPERKFQSYFYIPKQIFCTVALFSRPKVN